MLNVYQSSDREGWQPQPLSEEEILRRIEAEVPEESRTGIWFVILQIAPYLDAVLVSFAEKGEELDGIRRFTFHEGYGWTMSKERIFREFCLHNPQCRYHHEQMDAIFAYYRKEYPGFHLKRYYTHDFRMLDHIYHCCRRNTAQEILYKAGLDELAEAVDGLDELDLLAGSPTEIYGGVPIRVLRALNSGEGARLLETRKGRGYVMDLQRYFPQIFRFRMNEAQCRYLRRLWEEQLTAGEAGRLYLARSSSLQTMWCDSQYLLFDMMERGQSEVKRLSAIDPIYEKYLTQTENEGNTEGSFGDLQYYLLYNREKYDQAIRRSNRKRNYDWQERGREYVVRYPQTINDFCREAIYMSNCLMGYVESVIHNDTTILFLRKANDFNTPFITMEIFEGRLMQAYHRFNRDCTETEAQWIREYCERHGIDSEGFQFDRELDLLF